MSNKNAFTASFNLALKRSFVFLLVLCIVLGGSLPGVRAMDNILYAKPEATGAGDCSAWENACGLQTALTNAVSGDQIWVMAGRHIPTATGERSATFQLMDGVAVYGGFDGSETSLDQRDWVVNVTILSGDLNGDDDGFTNNGENSYHVVTGATGATLDGFTISGGNANRSTPNERGGGMYNSYSSPTLSNIIFSGNYANLGGGLYNTDSSPALTSVIFRGNTAYWGGGMYNLNLSNPSVIKVTFTSNHATLSGAGMFNGVSSPTLTNVTFSGNEASKGGGLYNGGDSNPTLTNVTFNGNIANNGGGIYNFNNSNPSVHNSILWGDTGGEIYNEVNSTPILSYSDVQGGYAGTGNFDADPLLAPLGDYAGEVETMALLPGSPVIDATSSNCPETDARDVTRSSPNCDLGAFESQGFTLAKTAGDNQTAYIYGYFDQSLCAGVTANDILEPVDGGKVTLYLSRKRRFSHLDRQSSLDYQWRGLCHCTCQWQCRRTVSGHSQCSWSNQRDVQPYEHKRNIDLSSHHNKVNKNRRLPEQEDWLISNPITIID